MLLSSIGLAFFVDVYYFYLVLRKYIILVLDLLPFRNYTVCFDT